MFFSLLTKSIGKDIKYLSKQFSKKEPIQNSLSNLKKDKQFFGKLFKTTKILTAPVRKPLFFTGKKIFNFAKKNPGKALTFTTYGIGAYSSINEGLDRFYKLSSERELEMNKKANLAEVSKTILSKIPEAFGSSLGSAMAGATVAGLGLGVAYMANRAQTAMVTNQARRAFEEAIRDPELANADRRKLEQFFMTILRFSPKVATDPVLLKNYLKQAMVYGTVDIQTVKALQDVQKNMGIGEPSLIKKLI